MLAGSWSSDQEGYGHLRLQTIFNGGDPTGLVRRIHWFSWGHKHAVGSATAEWVGPHQIVADATQQNAKVVLFHLGRCHGRRAYDAIEWYFLQHGQHFTPGTYINTCTGKYYLNGHVRAPDVMGSRTPLSGYGYPRGRLRPPLHPG